MPGSTLEIFAGAGHFPFRDDPVRFVACVQNFLDATRPAPVDTDAWRAALAGGNAASGMVSRTAQASAT